MLLVETLFNERLRILAELIDLNRKFLWAICYRMTGDAAEAEDIVQETFLKAMEKPLDLTDESGRPWLIRVAMNLSRDHLRWRRRRGYYGVWLPSPLPTESVDDQPEFISIDDKESSPTARYELRESISIAFLLALEALTPTQRAVLLLRDVFDYSTRETAEVLQMSEVNVKVTLLRARKIMSNYDKARANLDSIHQKRTRQMLESFLSCLQARDSERLEQLLTEDVVVVSDGGGEVSALRAPICGRNNVVRLIARINELYRNSMQIRFASLNGLPGLIVQRSETRDGHAKCFTLQCEIDMLGKIARLNYVFAPNKLTAIIKRGVNS